jgi:adenylate cyclase
MFSQLRYRIKKGHKLFAIGLGMTSAVLLATAVGAFEGVEVGLLDVFFRMRSASVSREDARDSRILVVTVGEDDISNMGQWPMSDETLAELVRQISKHDPASIGLDLYRNLPIEPGVDELSRVFEATPHVVGIERVIGAAVLPHSTLERLGQTAAADLIVDTDGVIRRGLLSVIAPNGEVKQGLAAVLALNYLSALEIEPEVLDERGFRLQLGKGRVSRFHKNDGSYVNADTGGFQVLMNYRGDSHQFESISVSKVLAGQLTDEKVRDRIVLVGSTAVSLNDFFHTPTNRKEQVAGVYVHAHLISQLLDVALQGRSLLRTVPSYAEWLWTGLWIAASIWVSRSVLYSRSVKSEVSAWQLIARLLGVSVGSLAAGYGLFLWGWWVPVVLPIVAMGATTVLGVIYRSQQLQNLAAFDELTQVANRRYFDQHLAEAMKVNRQLSLILCDVDYFKAFNDRYGHPAGDRCLQQVAYALKLAVRDADLVARYGGEEFVIVLPDTDDKTALIIAERIQQQVRQLEVVHQGSKVSDWVTLSCGAASVLPGFSLSPLRLIEYADQALYEAKQSGRAQVVLSQWKTLKTSKLPASDEQSPDQAA